MVQYKQPFALMLGNHGYIKYERRKFGINLKWSETPSFEWEFRRGSSTGPVNTSNRVSLYNRIEKDYVVYWPRKFGINLRWLKDTKRTNSLDWEIVGQLPHIRLKNITAKNKHKSGNAFVVYGKRSYGINLVWSGNPAYNNFDIIPRAQVSLPPTGIYTPGEKTMNNRRPHTWTIEWNGKEGLDFKAYYSSIRSPYIQDVTPNSAVVLWRVGIPKAWDPKVWAAKLHAIAWIAPIGKNVKTGRSYNTMNQTYPIKAEDIRSTYKYDNSRFGNDYWLDSVISRPVIQFKVIFKGLRPDTVYHYRIESDGITDPGDTSLASSKIVLADDVYFKTAPTTSQDPKISFVAMGDLGPGDSKPSYFYDVFDLFHKIARKHGPDLWLALGDIDNDTDGHPNAMDPFFFNIYNAFHNTNNPLKTSNTKMARKTPVKAFRTPPYYGLLSGLPVFPTFGNHDICTKYDSSLNYWKKAYKRSFILPTAGWCPAAANFNSAGKGFFYTFRYGNVIFISLGLPRTKGCSLGGGETWKRKWGRKQEEKLKIYLQNIQSEMSKKTVWVVAYFHDHNNGLSIGKTYPKIFLKYGIDIALMGHEHFFKQKTVKYRNFGYRAIVVGTGGFGDTDPGDYCHRPGFILVEAQGDVLRYWKYDTHICYSNGAPKGRDALKHRIKEYCKIKKIGRGKHNMEEVVINRRV